MGSHYVIMLSEGDTAGSSSGSCQHKMRSVLLPYTVGTLAFHSDKVPGTYVRTYARTHGVGTYVRTVYGARAVLFIKSVSCLSEDVGSVLVTAPTLSLHLPSLVAYSDSGLVGNHFRCGTKI